MPPEQAGAVERNSQAKVADLGGHRRPGHTGEGTRNRQDPYSPRIVRGGRDAWGRKSIGVGATKVSGPR